MVEGLNRKRNSNIELLRIIAMLFIITSHSYVHGIGLGTVSEISINNIILDWFVLGNLGVDIFVIISGYFMCGRMDSRRNLGKLLSQVWFYSVLCFAVYLIYTRNLSSVNMDNLWTVIFPTIFTEYWFFTAYIVMLLLTPYINIIFEKTGEKEYKELLIIMVFMWCIIPTFTENEMYGSEIPQFIMLYAIGGYFRKCSENILQKKSVRYLAVIVSCIVMMISAMQEETTDKLMLYERNALTTIVCATGLFGMALYSRPYSNSFINRVAGCTFGIYLFHDNPFIRKILWTDWMPNYLHINSVYLIPRIILSILVIFICCTVIELIRQKIFAGKMTKVMNDIINNIKMLVNRFI